MRVHANCVICSPSNERGLGLAFEAIADGCVQAALCCANHLEGYRGYLHGGIIASLLDEAMTNCLLLHGRMGVTAELNVRFLGPVAVGGEVTVRAFIEEDHHPLFRLKADLLQEGEIKASARGKFVAGSGIEEAA